MKTQAIQHYRQLLYKDHISHEIGGDAFPTVIPNVIQKCELDLLESPITNMDWGKCRQTLVKGSCWQHLYLSMTLEEWNNFVKKRKQELGG